MKTVLCALMGMVVLFVSVHNIYGLGISDFEKITNGMTYNEVMSLFNDTGEFDYVINTKTNEIVGDVVVKWGGGIIAGPKGMNRTRLGYIMIRFTDISDNDPRTGKVTAIICCGLSNDSRCTCDKGVEEIYKDQIPEDVDIKEITTKRIKTRTLENL